MKSLNVLFAFCTITIICTQFLHAQTIVTMASLLKEMAAPSSVTKWPVPFYRELQASSYDRRSISPTKPGWFANGDASQFIRTEEINGHKEYVMMDADGPGAIIRFWITTFKREGTLRVYFDNQTTPEIIIPAYDLMKIGPPDAPKADNTDSYGENTIYADKFRCRTL